MCECFAAFLPLQHRNLKFEVSTCGQRRPPKKGRFHESRHNCRTSNTTHHVLSLDLHTRPATKPAHETLPQDHCHKTCSGTLPQDLPTGPCHQTCAHGPATRPAHEALPHDLFTSAYHKTCSQGLAARLQPLDPLTMPMLAPRNCTTEPGRQALMLLISETPQAQEF